MFGIGYQEMFIILVVALVVFGPSRLPELAGQVGRWVRDFRRMSADLTGEFEKTFAEVDEVKKSFKRELEGIQEEVEGIGKSAKRDLKKSTAKPATGAKKSPTGALKSGSAARAAKAKAAVPANGAESATITAVAVSNGAANGLPRATKADPLVDVSFFEMDVVHAATEDGNIAAGNGAATDDALERVRRRRASAAYSRRTAVS